MIIPSLQEVLKGFPQVKFTVEIKPSDPPIEEPVIAVIKDCGKADDVIIASEHDAVLARVRTLAPDIPTNFGYNEVVDFIQRVATGQLDGYQPPGQALPDPAHISGYSVSDGTKRLPPHTNSMWKSMRGRLMSHTRCVACLTSEWTG